MDAGKIYILAKSCQATFYYTFHSCTRGVFRAGFCETEREPPCRRAFVKGYFLQSALWEEYILEKNWYRQSPCRHHHQSLSGVADRRRARSATCAGNRPKIFPSPEPRSAQCPVRPVRLIYVEREARSAEANRFPSPQLSRPRSM